MPGSVNSVSPASPRFLASIFASPLGSFFDYHSGLELTWAILFLTFGSNLYLVFTSDSSFDSAFSLFDG